MLPAERHVAASAVTVRTPPPLRLKPIPPHPASLPSEFAWTLPAEVTTPVPEIWIALQAVGPRASMPNPYVTPCWSAATELTPTGHPRRPMTPAKIELWFVLILTWITAGTPR